MPKKTEPAAAAIWLHVDDLTPWKFNPRKNDHAVERVAKNIEALGFGSPIVARTLPDGKREIIAGHTRLKAMKWLVRELDEQQRASTGFESFEIEKLFGTPVENPLDEWKGMPEFKGEKLSKRQIVVHFKSDDDARAFGELLGQLVTDKTKFLWYPEEKDIVARAKQFFVKKDANTGA